MSQSPQAAFAASMSTDITDLAVVIPARNEALMLPGCLTAVEKAADRLHVLAPQVRVTVWTVLDACTDASEDVAARHGARVLSITAGSVGVARAHGFAAVIADACERSVALPQLWIASTDADSIVPENWLASQWAFAVAGVDATVGTVEPDDHLNPAAKLAWLKLHTLEEDHPHIHGANFGVRANAYQQVGGFRPLVAHEDVDLVDRLRAAEGVVVRSTDAHRVITSSREDGRAANGFADYLKDLRRAVN